MAKADLSSYFTGFNGRIDNTVFYTVGRRVYSRRYVIPRNPKSESQEAHRSLFAEAMAEWKLLSEDMKQQYRKKARKLHMHAHNLFIKQYIKLNKNNRNTAVPHPSKSSEPVSPQDISSLENTQHCTPSESALFSPRNVYNTASIQTAYPLYTPPV